MTPPMEEPRSGGRPAPFVRPAPQRRARLRAHAQRPAADVAAQALRYGRSFRLPLATLAAEHPAYADLLFSCPAAAVSLAARRGAPAARGEALYLLRRGAPLVEIMTALELPHWLKKLAPEAFLSAPPDPMPGDPGRAAPGGYDPRADDAFGRHALNFAPQKSQSAWLSGLLRARALGGDAFARWLLAQRPPWARLQTLDVPIAPLALYAWFSERPDTQAGARIRERWSAEMRLQTAAHRAEAWFCELWMEQIWPPEGSLWRQPRTLGGLTFTLLAPSAEAFRREGAEMRNCLEGYGVVAGMQASLVFSVKRKDRSVATIEIVEHRGKTERGSLAIRQCLGRANRKASPTVLREAAAWLAELEEARAEARRQSRRDPLIRPIDAAAWRAHFEPYLAAHPSLEKDAEPVLARPTKIFAALTWFGSRITAAPVPNA